MRLHNVAPVLSNAAAVLDEQGWCQREYFSPGGEACLVGAVKAVEPNYTRRMQAYDFVRQVIGVDTQFLTDWNDDAGRTVDEVTAALRKASELAKEAYDQQR